MAENNITEVKETKENPKEYMKYRKNSKPFATTLNVDIIDQLNELTKATDIPKSKLVEQGLKLLFEQYKGDAE